MTGIIIFDLSFPFNHSFALQTIRKVVRLKTNFLKKQIDPFCEIELLLGGSGFFHLIEQLVKNAKKSVHLHTYIFSNDTTGCRVADALIQAAGKGIEVYVLADGYASQNLPQDFIVKMKDAGIHFRFFEPLLKSRYFYFGRRLHHKILVIDGEQAIVCGLNIADRYNDLPQQKAWFDTGILIKGKTAEFLAQICQNLWTKKRKIHRNGSEKKAAYDAECGIRICRNDWVMRKQEISICYRNLFGNAQKSITILCSYFLPGTIFRKKLKQAVKRGVQVKVVLTGESDVKIAKYAERYLYRWMLRNKMEVYEYMPTVLHAKMAIADDEVLTIGSYNVNDLSARASIELNVEVKNTDFVQSVSERINGLIETDCKSVKQDSIHLFSFTQFLQFCSFYFLRGMLHLSTFYFKKNAS